MYILNKKVILLLQIFVLICSIKSYLSFKLPYQFFIFVISLCLDISSIVVIVFARIEMNVSVEIRWQEEWYMILRSVPRPVKETPYKVVGVHGELLSTRTHLINKVNILSSYCFLPMHLRMFPCLKLIKEAISKPKSSSQ